VWFPGLLPGHSSKSARLRCYCRLSSTASHTSTTISRYSGLSYKYLRQHVQMCVDRHKWRVLCHGLPSLFVSSWSSGFSPPLCYQVSSALSPKYYLWICHPLSLPASGSPLRVGFITMTAVVLVRAGGLPWVRHTTSPYPVRLHVGSIPRISGFA